MLQAVGWGGLVLSGISTQRLLVSYTIACWLEEITRLLLEQVKWAIVVIVDRLQKAVKSVLVFVFEGLLKSSTLVVSWLNRLFLIPQFLSILLARLKLTITRTRARLRSVDNETLWILEARGVAFWIASLLEWLQSCHLLQKILVYTLRAGRFLPVSRIIESAVSLTNFTSADCAGDPRPWTGLLPLSREEVNWCCIYDATAAVNIAETGVVDFWLEGLYLLTLLYTAVNVSDTGRGLEVGVFAIFLFCGRT